MGIYHLNIDDRIAALEAKLQSKLAEIERKEQSANKIVRMIAAAKRRTVISDLEHEIRKLKSKRDREYGQTTSY